MSPSGDRPPLQFSSHAEMASLIQRFESQSLPRQDWTHAAHLAVAIWYLTHCPYAEALHRIRSGIQQYNRATGVETTSTSGYHETLTLFWVAIARHFLTRASGTALDRTNQFIRQYATSQRLFLTYYSSTRIMSANARQQWVEPDLQPLPSI